MAAITASMMGGDVAPKVSAFRDFMLNLTEQVCQEFEREVSQLSEDIVKYRGELARCADLLAYQLGKEGQYHNMLENICNNTKVLVGHSAEVGQKHSGNEDQKRAMMQMIEDMANGSSGIHGSFHGEIDEHRHLAEQHLMSSSELQNQSKAVQDELDRILETLKMPPVSYHTPPMVVGPSMMGGKQQYGGGLQSPQQQYNNMPRSGPSSPTSPGFPGRTPNSPLGSGLQSPGSRGAQTRPGGQSWF